MSRLPGPNGPEQPHLDLHSGLSLVSTGLAGAIMQTDLYPSCFLAFLPC